MISIDVDTAAGRALLGELVDVINGDRRMRDLAGDLLADYEAEVFGTQGFGQWAPNDPSTVRAKGSGRVLVDTGGLMAEMTSQGSVRSDGDGYAITTDRESAGYLKRGARGMPVRDAAPEPTQAVAERWADQVLNLVTGGRG